MVMRIVLGLAAVGLGAAVLVMRQPSEFRVARTARIAAPPATIFPHVEDVRKFNEWNPWMKLDPAVHVTYEGPSTGPGASMAWAGNRSVGEGRMTVIASRPHELVRFRLEFLKPFASTATAEFTLVPEGPQTAVTWTTMGANTLIGKVMGLVMSMDAMMGEQFEKGLADLRARTEASAQRSDR